MVNPIESASLSLHKLIETALLKTAPEIEIPKFTIEIPADKAHGDFASNVAMLYAKPLKSSPKQIAEKITSHISLDGSCFSKAEIAGPGFLNFFLSDDWFKDVLTTVKSEGEKYGSSDYGEGKKVLLEFVSANPTGPMHIGNARGGAIGDCLADILAFSGYDVKREFYINDAGNQIDKFALSLETRYLQIFDESVKMPEDAYLGEDITNHAKAFSEIHGDKYVSSPENQRREALVAFALPKNIEALRTDLLKYSIEYDNWYKESSLHENGKVTEIIEKLKSNGVTYEKDGALWFKAEQFGADKDFVLVRANGVPTYATPDIAYHYDKLVTRGFDKAINILGADHHGYAARLKAALKALDIDPDRLDIILMQMVRLVRGSEVVKVSKRSGKAITLVTLLEDIPVSAARFYFNLREANTHFEFDLDLAVEKSSQNPVYYAQYSYARLCSLLQKADIKPVLTTGNLLTKPQEKELIRCIATFPNEIKAAAKSYDSSRITRYTLTLATLFHKFYEACPVLKAESPELISARLLLCFAVKQVLQNAFNILKVECVEQM